MIMKGERLENQLFALVLYITVTKRHVKSGRQILPFFSFFWSLLRKPPLVHDAQFSIYLPPVPDCGCPLFGCFKRSQIQGFQQRCITRKYASLAVELSIGGIERFYGIGRIDHFSHAFGKLENRRNRIPVIFPAFHRVRIFRTPFLTHSLKKCQGFFLVRCLINCL